MGQKLQVIYRNPFPRGSKEARKESMQVVKEAIDETNALRFDSVIQTCNASHELFDGSSSPDLP